MIDPLKTFQLYMSLKTHFTSDSYCAIEHRGRLKNTDLVHFNNRRDKQLFINFSRLVNTSQEMSSLLVANFGYGNAYPLDDHDLSIQNFNKWKRIRQSLTKTFKDDITFLLENSEDQEVQNLFKFMIANKVSRETVIIYDSFSPVFDQWIRNLPLWKDEIRRVRKLASFVRFDTNKFKNLYFSIKEEVKEKHHEIL